MNVIVFEKALMHIDNTAANINNSEQIGCRFGVEWRFWIIFDYYQYYHEQSTTSKPTTKMWQLNKFGSGLNYDKALHLKSGPQQTTRAISYRYTYPNMRSTKQLRCSFGFKRLMECVYTLES